VDGQVHGGIAQGLAQALYEEVVYDAHGQLVTGSLMDYAVPKAHFFPDFTLEIFERHHHFDPPHRIEPNRLAASLLRTWARAEAARPADAEATGGLTWAAGAWASATRRGRPPQGGVLVAGDARPQRLACCRARAEAERVDVVGGSPRSRSGSRKRSNGLGRRFLYARRAARTYDRPKNGHAQFL